MAVIILLAGLGRLVPLVVCTVVAAAVCLPLKVHFAQASSAEAVIWSNVLVFSCCALIPYAIVVPRLVRGQGLPWPRRHRRE
jgi:hypothetical protein